MPVTTTAAWQRALGLMQGGGNTAEAGDEPEELPDIELFTRARAGDTVAIDLVWRRHYPYALKVARRYTRSHSDADDLAAEAFVRILSLLRAGRGPREHGKTYVARTVRNIATDRSRRRQPPTTVIDEAHDLPAWDDPASAALSAMELGDVLEGLAACPPRQRYALQMTVFEGVPIATVAQDLGISKNAVAALLVRARESIRRFVARGVHEQGAPEHG
ncbi:RNA polymerase sigma factor [Promicromonospora sukumoe]|uniref:RNA polymerase sigma factor n=1 Tax=Promicromonospora sukumoe TaxID=88382 RepID=UPI000366509C|nr:sigma-70 family RNA polymerase sigma factor [Promicromonospora sukumoe]